MKSEIVYVELKTGYSDNGPAWIGKAKLNPNQFKVVELDNSDIRDRIYKLENRKLTPEIYESQCSKYSKK